MSARPLGWVGIVRLGLVQASLGAVVVLTTSTMNRIMVVELALPATLPGFLVALHYMVQVLRPRFGHGSDVGGRRTPWIVGGVAALACGAVGAAMAVSLMSSSILAGIALATASFIVIGLGVGAAGTAMLVMLSKRVIPQRRAAAATITWVMMIAGFIVTAATAGHFLDPYSPERLLLVTACVAGAACVASALAVWGLERADVDATPEGAADASVESPNPRFRSALRDVWTEPQSRRLTSFIFVSMLAYSAQDLILEPFAGAVFGLTPGESTKLSGVQNGGVLAGMLALALVGSGVARGRFGSMRLWTVIGCIASALALAGLAAGSFVGPGWPLRPSVFLLGVANGTFAVAAIGSMMEMVGAGHRSREGVRMGVWGAAQAIAFALGGLVGTAAVDVARHLLGSAIAAYGVVFAGEAALFVFAASLAARVRTPRDASRALTENRDAVESPSNLIASVAGRH